MDAAELLDGYARGQRDFRGRILRDLDLTGVDLRGADLREADLSGARLCEARLAGVNFLYASMRETVLLSADLSGARLGWADLSRARLEGANLSGANLNHAVLEDADLRRTILRRASLCEAKMCRARFAHAEFTHALFCGADLIGTDLRKSDLDEADFTDARLPIRLCLGPDGEPMEAFTTPGEFSRAYVRRLREHGEVHFPAPIAFAVFLSLALFLGIRVAESVVPFRHEYILVLGIVLSLFLLAATVGFELCWTHTQRRRRNQDGKEKSPPR